MLLLNAYRNCRATVFRLALASVFILPALASAQGHEGLYQVEMIVFARKNDTAQEHWPRNLNLHYPANWVELRSDAEANTFNLLAKGERSLSAQARKFEQDPRFQLLFHEVWRQTISHKKAARAIVINGGKTFGKHQELEGTITLSVATYLELKTNLWLTQFDVNNGQEVATPWPNIPLRPNYQAAGNSGLSQDENAELQQALDNENPQSSQQINVAGQTTGDKAYATKRIILLKQERDMRSNEVHYLDHPVVGLIIKITPYPPLATVAP